MEVFNPVNTNAIASTSTSQARAFPTGGVGDSCVYYNDGPNLVFITTGSSAVVATLPALSAAAGAQGNATPIPIGAAVNITQNQDHSYWAAICQVGGTANVYCTPGSGL